MTSGVVWTPPADAVRRFRVGRLLAASGEPDLSSLVARAAREPEWFWPRVVDDLELPFTRPFERVVDLARGPEWADWFVGGELNLTAACVHRHARGAASSRTALVAEREDGSARGLTFAELAREVDRCATALECAGIGFGDRVAAYLPTGAEVAILMFATIARGALFLPVFSGFGAEALAERLRDSGAKLLVTAGHATRRGQAIDLLAPARAARAAAPAVETLVVLDPPAAPGPGELSWSEFLARADDAPAREPPPVHSSHPALLLYTSGTTGRPKGTVHAHAGTLVNIAKEHAYAFDVGPGDVFFWVTDIGWMMGPWLLIGALCHGATAVLYDGAIDWPDADRLWETTARRGVTILGVSPTAIRMLRRSGAEPRRHDLAALRILGSTGEPWDEESWLWTFREVGRERCPIVNISGGTDLVGCWLSPTPLTPLKPASLGGPGLGMSIDVFDEAGRSVRGEVGYLVATRPAPSMTRGLWNDPERYLESYWSRWPGIWDHGDWALVDADGHWFLRGRADDTLKVAGKRLGPAEVEGAVLATGKIVEAAAIGVPDELKGEAIAVYAVPKPGVAPSDELRAELAAAVAERLGKLARPREVRFVRDLPKTRSAKILRRLVKAVALGEERLGDLSTLANPEAIDAVRDAV